MSTGHVFQMRQKIVTIGFKLCREYFLTFLLLLLITDRGHRKDVGTEDTKEGGGFMGGGAGAGAGVAFCCLDLVAH